LNRQQSVTENTEERLWNIYNRYDKKWKHSKIT
jgi:hypothetical protein